MYIVKEKGAKTGFTKTITPIIRRKVYQKKTASNCHIKFL